MKLKTLNDLERFEDLKHSDHFIVSSAVLKAEAIKWVKEDKIKISKMTKSYQTPSRIILRKWMFRFNITEEDLKQLS